MYVVHCASFDSIVVWGTVPLLGTGVEHTFVVYGTRTTVGTVTDGRMVDVKTGERV